MWFLIGDKSFEMSILLDFFYWTTRAFKFRTRWQEKIQRRILPVYNPHGALRLAIGFHACQAEIESYDCGSLMRLNPLSVVEIGSGSYLKANSMNQAVSMF